MIDISQGIDSLTNFKRRTTTFVKHLRKTGRPMLLTIKKASGRLLVSWRYSCTPANRCESNSKTFASNA